ncbi:MAG: type II toxin-antitoxin system VapC family toxin [Burkholderiales bacterium]
MILLDTQVLLFDALDPRRLSRRARGALEEGEQTAALACSDISLWEIALLAAKRRIEAGPDIAAFIESVLRLRAVRVLPISSSIATIAQSDLFAHGDPADRLIGATALQQRVPLVSADEKLRRIRELEVIW